MKLLSRKLIHEHRKMCRKTEIPLQTNKSEQCRQTSKRALKCADAPQLLQTYYKELVIARLRLEKKEGTKFWTNKPCVRSTRSSQILKLQAIFHSNFAY